MTTPASTDKKVVTPEIKKSKKPQTDKKAFGIELNNSSSSAAVLFILSNSLNNIESLYIDKSYKQTLAQVANDPKLWRFGYTDHFVRLALIGSESKKNSLTLATQALQALEESVVYRDLSGSVKPLRQAVLLRCNQLLNNNNNLSDLANNKNDSMFGTGIIMGENVSNNKISEFELPFNDEKGKGLSGKNLDAKLNEWVNNGIMEPGAASSFKLFCSTQNQNPNYLTNHTFVIIGAGSQLGPAKSLLSWGARVIAIDLPRPSIWKDLLSHAKKSRGQLIVPILKKENTSTNNNNLDYIIANAGADLLTDTPDLAAWIISEVKKLGGSCVIGSYVYMDGAKFVLVSAAADILISSVCDALGPKNVTVAALLSPTEVHIVPPESQAMSQERYNSWSVHQLWRAPLKLASKGAYLAPNTASVVKLKEEGQDKQNGVIHVLDNLVVQQGPNYAFAKQVQKWRLILQRSRGHNISGLVAPASLTESVMHNKLIAAGMHGASHFLVEPFAVSTASTLCAALLVQSVLNPDNPGKSLSDICPMLEFSWNAVHGGTWRCAYKVGSVAEVSALVHYAQKAQPFIVASAVGAGLLIGRSKL